MDDPYSGLLLAFRGQVQIPVSFRLGKVLSADPLRISVGGTEQAGNDLLKDADIGELHDGDTVLLVPLDDDQKYLILCRVVSI